MLTSTVTHSQSEIGITLTPFLLNPYNTSNYATYTQIVYIEDIDFSGTSTKYLQKGGTVKHLSALSPRPLAYHKKGRDQLRQPLG